MVNNYGCSYIFTIPTNWLTRSLFLRRWMRGQGEDKSKDIESLSSSSLYDKNHCHTIGRYFPPVFCESVFIRNRCVLFFNLITISGI